MKAHPSALRDVGRPGVALVDLDQTFSDNPNTDWLSGHMGYDLEAVTIARQMVASMGWGLVFMSNRLRTYESRADAFLQHVRLFAGAPLFMADQLSPASIHDATLSTIARVRQRYNVEAGYAFHDDVAAAMYQAGLLTVRPPVLDKVHG